MPSVAVMMASRSCCSASTNASSPPVSKILLELLPSRPPSDLVRQVTQRRSYVSLEPQANGVYFIRTAAPLPDSGAHKNESEGRYIVAIYQVPRAALGAL